jgi:diguanylate cyclase (GGDEF)-like protein
MGVTWLAGATLVLGTLLLPHATAAWAALLVGALGYTGAAVMLTVRRLPPWAFEFFIGLGTLLVSMMILATGDGDTPYCALYLWLTVQAFYFLPVRHAAAHLGLVAAAYGGALLTMPASGPGPLAFTLCVSTVIATGAFVAALRRRIDRLVLELEHAALCDPLTGLLNRRGFVPRVTAELELARREDRTFTVLALDLDGFKDINDTRGHEAGDRALARTADALRSACRASDICCRMGGDEFAVLLPRTDAHGADAARERVRHALTDRDPELVASIGAATYPLDGDTVADLLRAADHALYAAKAAVRVAI